MATFVTAAPQGELFSHNQNSQVSYKSVEVLGHNSSKLDGKENKAEQVQPISDIALLFEQVEMHLKNKLETLRKDSPWDLNNIAAFEWMFDKVKKGKEQYLNKNQAGTESTTTVNSENIPIVSEAN